MRRSLILLTALLVVVVVLGDIACSEPEPVTQATPDDGTPTQTLKPEETPTAMSQTPLGQVVSTKWEYTSERGYIRDTDFLTRLNELGLDGWELVTYDYNDGGKCILKRPLR